MIAKQDGEIADLKAKLAKLDDGSLFDLKKDGADDIATAIVNNVSEHKAKAIAKGLLRQVEACGVSQMPRNFKNPDAALSLPEGQNLKFERADWTAFRTVEGLQQKAGVAANRLARLVLKELADNALDTGARVKVGQLKGGYFVEDDGPGIDGNAGHARTDWILLAYFRQSRAQRPGLDPRS